MTRTERSQIHNQTINYSRMNGNVVARKQWGIGLTNREKNQATLEDETFRFSDGIKYSKNRRKEGSPPAGPSPLWTAGAGGQ